MIRRLWPVAVLALAGCYDVERIRQQPVEWSATYSTPFDTMANCLTAAYFGSARVAPQIYQRERRADVTIAINMAVVAEYQIDTLADGRTEVKWRGGMSREGRERADRCGRA